MPAAVRLTTRQLRNRARPAPMPRRPPRLLREDEGIHHSAMEKLPGSEGSASLEQVTADHSEGQYLVDEGQITALEALTTHGAMGGLSLTVRRILRCVPWATGGIDPVPEGKRTFAPGAEPKIILLNHPHLYTPHTGGDARPE